MFNMFAFGQMIWENTCKKVEKEEALKMAKYELQELDVKIVNCIIKGMRLPGQLVSDRNLHLSIVANEPTDKEKAADEIRRRTV